MQSALPLMQDMQSLVDNMQASELFADVQQAAKDAFDAASKMSHGEAKHLLGSDYFHQLLDTM